MLGKNHKQQEARHKSAEARRDSVKQIQRIAFQLFSSFHAGGNYRAPLMLLDEGEVGKMWEGLNHEGDVFRKMLPKQR